MLICECTPQWLESPKLMSADAGAEYFETIEINMDEITEPIVCCPNDPDDARLLSEVRNQRVISASSARHQRVIVRHGIRLTSPPRCAVTRWMRSSSGRA